MLKATHFELYDLARSTLWVEDNLTRLVLTEFWADTDIRVWSAAGRSGVEHLVQAAPRGFVGRNVVGLVDRDFYGFNPDDWSNPNTPILFTPTHEIENLLLDFNVLSALSGQEEAAVIEAKAKGFAESLTWWMACRRVCHEFFREATAYFPPAPGVPSPDAPMDQQAAVDHINKSKYRKEHQTVLRTWDEAYVERKIKEYGASYDADLTSGEWVRSFSGKEIFRHVRSVVKGLSKLAKGKTAAENDEDLGKRIGRLLRKKFEQTSPTARVLKDIRIALRARVGLRP